MQCEPWQETAPSAVELDTVALWWEHEWRHRMGLGYTDIFSGWTEARAAWNRGAHALANGWQRSVKVKAFHYAARSRLRQWHRISQLVRYYRQHHPEVTPGRSRPYHKNDNAHIEQKNYSHAPTAKDDRFADFGLIKPFNNLFIHWSFLNYLYEHNADYCANSMAPTGK